MTKSLAFKKKKKFKKKSPSQHLRQVLGKRFDAINPNKFGLLRVVFLGEENLFYINITLYNCHKVCLKYIDSEKILRLSVIS